MNLDSRKLSEAQFEDQKFVTQRKINLIDLK